MIVRPVVARLQALGVSAWNVVPEDDVASFLRQRVRRINQRQSQLPKLAVSVHANAWSPADAPLQFTSPSGTETFYCPGSVRGKKLAELFQRHLVAALGLKDRGIKDSPAMYITRKTIPVTVLLEIGFFTNLVEVAKLRDPVFQEKVIEAIIATVLHVEKHGL
jgi:N-acetylmuramoyl-L-alanine amidase